MQKGSFSYLEQTIQHFTFRRNSLTVTFTISPVNNNVAVFEFKDKNNCTIQPPQGFTIRDGVGQIVNHFNNGFFLVWLVNYELVYTSENAPPEVIWSLFNQKRQNYMYHQEDITSP